ncbi:MAG: GNAT family N-acetyltransferase [bacterium]
MSSAHDYGPVHGPDELSRHVEILGWSFAIPKEDLVEFFARVGSDKVRVWREGGRPVAGLSLLTFPQLFGGRPVPMTGVNLVGTAPEARGRGVATRLMEASVREMRASGVPISTLYPAKQTLYRRVGWEVTGARWELSVNARDIDATSRELSVRAAGPSDMPAVEEVYGRSIRGQTGPIERPDYMWRRIVDPPKKDVSGFVIDGPSGVEGYVFLRVARTEGLRQELTVLDCAAVTPKAAQRLLSFLADHDSLADRVVWFGSPAMPLVGFLAEYVWKARVYYPWMVRILDAKAALEARGYPLGLRAELHFDLTDPLLPENAGRFVLEVADGTGKTRSGGRGAIRAHVRGLAAIYGGWSTPDSAKALGLLDGEDADLAAAAAVFAGPVPWMSDMF